MYAEKSITGINLIDMTYQQAMIIRDSLLRAVHTCDLESPEKRAADLLINALDTAIIKLTPNVSW